MRPRDGNHHPRYGRYWRPLLHTAVRHFRQLHPTPVERRSANWRSLGESRSWRSVLQGLRYIAIAFLQFFKQPHVLNGDNGLGSEGFKQFDLFSREWTNFHAADMDRADGYSLAQ